MVATKVTANFRKMPGPKTCVSIITVRLSKELHERAKAAAERNNISLNLWCEQQLAIGVEENELQTHCTALESLQQSILIFVGGTVRCSPVDSDTTDLPNEPLDPCHDVSHESVFATPTAPVEECPQIAE